LGQHFAMLAGNADGRLDRFRAAQARPHDRSHFDGLGPGAEGQEYAQAWHLGQHLNRSPPPGKAKFRQGDAGGQPDSRRLEIGGVILPSSSFTRIKKDSAPPGASPTGLAESLTTLTKPLIVAGAAISGLVMVSEYG
jgi:hypothetical protein